MTEIVRRRNADRTAASDCGGESGFVFRESTCIAPAGKPSSDGVGLRVTFGTGTRERRGRCDSTLLLRSHATYHGPVQKLQRVQVKCLTIRHAARRVALERIGCARSAQRDSTHGVVEVIGVTEVSHSIRKRGRKHF